MFTLEFFRQKFHKIYKKQTNKQTNKQKQVKLSDEVSIETISCQCFF